MAEESERSNTLDLCAVLYEAVSIYIFAYIFTCNIVEKRTGLM